MMPQKISTAGGKDENSLITTLILFINKNSSKNTTASTADPS